MGKGDCCFVFKPNRGCFVLGLVTFLCSTIVTITSCYFVVLEEERTRLFPIVQGTHGSNHTHHILGLHMQKQVIDVMLIISLIIGVLWMAASLFLMYGIKKSKATCVLFYFFIGFVVTLLFIVIAILTMVHNMWFLSLPMILLSIMYAYCLATVFSMYEQLWQSSTASDIDQLILDQDFDSEIIDI